MPNQSIQKCNQRTFPTIRTRLKKRSIMNQVLGAEIESPNSIKKESNSQSKRMRKRSLTRIFLQLLRRGHLYLGLFLLPWAFLYGVTGFLFNHPTWFSDSPVIYFDSRDLVGTDLEKPPELNAFAKSIVTVLNEHNTSDSKWTAVDGTGRLTTRDSFVANVQSGSRSFFFVLDANMQSGLIRENTTKRTKPSIAPFATSELIKSDQQNPSSQKSSPEKLEGLSNLKSIVDCIQAAAPTIMERKGLPSGAVIVNSVPDLKFTVTDHDKKWTASYNLLTKQVTGVEGEPLIDLPWRSFLLMMHVGHKYPSEFNTKWFWALGVDAMALTLCFWGLSGLVMWWQIKSTRKIGAVVLLLSVIVAGSLSLGMFYVFRT